MPPIVKIQLPSKPDSNSHVQGTDQGLDASGSNAVTAAEIRDDIDNPPPPADHASTHENGGTDEIDVNGLSGELADPQPVKAHAASHENGESDELNVAGLSGELADAQPPKTHAPSHTDGSDDIQSATNLQKGLATPAQITALEANTAKVSADGSVTTHNDVTGAGSGEIITSLERTALGTAEQTANKGVNNGYAELDGSALVPLSQLPDSVKSGSEYKGAWNATTNSPALIDGTGTNGDNLRVSVAGTQDLGSGNITFAIGDLVIYNGTTLVWERIAGNPDLVQSVAGKQGVVTLVAADVTDFDAEVSNNADVAANTAARHTQGTDLGLDTGGANPVTAVDLRTHLDQNDSATISGSGLLTGGLLTINGGDDTKFDISDGIGWVVDTFTTPATPTITRVLITGKTAVAATFVVSEVASFIAINAAGGVVQQATEFTPAQYRDLIIIGVLMHPASVITATADRSRSLSDYLAYDLGRAIGDINVEGNHYTAAASDLTIQRSAGESFFHNINRDTDLKDPSFKNSADDPSVTFEIVHDDGSGGITPIVSQTDIDPDIYDDSSGTPAAVPNNRWTNQLVYFFPGTGKTVVRLGNEVFQNLAGASAATGLIPPEIGSGLDPQFVRTIISVQEGTADLSLSADARFTDTGRFGLTGLTGEGQFQDMQDIYENSIIPQILTDATRGALTIERGSAADTDDVIAVNNGASAQVFAVTGEGEISGVTVAGDMIATDTQVASGAIDDKIVTPLKLQNRLTPLLHYPLNEGTGATTADHGSAGIDATIVGGPAWVTDAKFGEFALDLENGGAPLGDYLVTDSNITKPADLSFAIWIKLESIGADTRIMSIWPDTDNQISFYINDGGSTVLSFYYDPGVAGHWLWNSPVLPTFVTDRWYHIGFSSSGITAATFYVDTIEYDGIPAHTAIVDGTPPVGPMYIGVHHPGSTLSEIDGLIDSPRFYNRVLSHSEFVELFQIGGPDQATELVAGIAKVATQPVTDDGVDDETIITPLKLAASTNGAWKLILKQTVSSSVASVDFTAGIDDTHDTYVLVIDGYTHSSDSASIYFRLGSGGSFHVTDYLSHVSRGQSGSSLYDADATTTLAILLCDNCGDATGEGYSGIVYIHNMRTTDVFPMIHFSGCGINEEAAAIIGIGAGANTITPVVAKDRVQVLPSSGTIDDGIFSLYGIKN